MDRSSFKLSLAISGLTELQLISVCSTVVPVVICFKLKTVPGAAFIKCFNFIYIRILLVLQKYAQLHGSLSPPCSKILRVNSIAYDFTVNCGITYYGTCGKQRILNVEHDLQLYHLLQQQYRCCVHSLFLFHKVVFY